MKLNGSETMQNLMRAFAGESQARNRYNMAASTARGEGQYFISKIFDFTALQEQAHATVFYGFLEEVNDHNFDFTASYPVNYYTKTADHLKAAIHNEYEEYNSAYKTFGRIAKEEGFNNIATAFDMIAQIEKIHAERFEEIYRMLTEGSITKSTEDSIWICSNCGHIHRGTSAPLICPVCSHTQGYFVNDNFKTKTTVLI